MQLVETIKCCLMNSKLSFKREREWVGKRTPGRAGGDNTSLGTTESN